MIEAPVLLVTFNRPNTTQQVFDAIKKALPKKLYVFNDGPRYGNNSDIAARNEIREIIKQVDWQCEVQLNFPEKNLGCGPGVSSAISWAFNNEDRLIILEDDCLPATPFYSFCNTLLEKYKNDTRICMISGNNYTENYNKTEDSYFFSKYGHIWGWATWKRAWEKYDYEMKDWPDFRRQDHLINVFTEQREQLFFLNHFNTFYNKTRKTTWDFQWFFCRIKEYGLSIVPNRNLVTNIGVQGVHTVSKSKAHFIPTYEEFAIVNEPQFVLCNTYYDKWHFRTVINKKYSLLAMAIRLPGRVYRKMLRILNHRNIDSNAE